MLEDVDYAKELIKDLMDKYNVEQIDSNFISYSKDYPYETTESLVKKGLIKKQ